MAKIVSFGPTRKVPFGHHWCFSCDGSGVSSLKADKKCDICKGKGHWNSADIAEYHQRFPAVCKASCGTRH